MGVRPIGETSFGEEGKEWKNERARRASRWSLEADEAVEGGTSKSRRPSPTGTFSCVPGIGYGRSFLTGLEQENLHLKGSRRSISHPHLTTSATSSFPPGVSEAALVLA